MLEDKRILMVPISTKGGGSFKEPDIVPSTLPNSISLRVLNAHAARSLKPATAQLLERVYDV